MGAAGMAGTGLEGGLDLRLSSPRTSGTGGPVGGEPPYWLVEEPDGDEAWVPDGEDPDGGDVEHQGGQGRTPGGAGDPEPFHWADAARWRPPAPRSDPDLPPPRWLGVVLRRAERAATPVEPVPQVQTFRLGCVLPSGGIIACVIRAVSPDAAWTRAVWDGLPEDVEAVLGVAAALTPRWMDEWSEWMLTPGTLTVRAVAAAMVEVAGWGCVTVGVRSCLVDRA